MRYALLPIFAVMAAMSLLLICNRSGFADDADNAASVHVKFAIGATELETLKTGAKFYSNRNYRLVDIPAEMDGLTFTHRAARQPCDVTLEISAGAKVYLLVDKSLTRQDVKDLYQSLDSTGWTKLTQLRPSHGNEATATVYVRTFADPANITLHGAGPLGLVVAAKHITLDTDSKEGQKPDEKLPASTLHIDPVPDNTPIPGPSTRPANAQATINALEVYEMEHGMMLGQTSEATLTLTKSEVPKLVTVHFITKVGDEMCLARDEAIRYIHLKYPNWYIGDAAITFEDKYVAHDGGSIGTALGTMILSCIQGFDIDPNIAITGDISANGKTRAIGGVSAKIKGAIASKCRLVAIPAANIDQLTDAVIYNGPQLVTDIQVIGISNLDDAIATVRDDRDPRLKQAIALFAQVQKALKDKPADVKTKDIQAKLHAVLELAPQHLSAQILLLIGENKEPKTLSATASQYYTYLAVDNMADVLKARADSAATASVPSSVVRTGLADLRKLRPMADPNVRPLIDAWSRFIGAWNEMQEGIGSPQTVEEQRQSLLDEMAKENADADMMQKMLRQGM